MAGQKAPWGQQEAATGASAATLRLVSTAWRLRPQGSAQLCASRASLLLLLRGAGNGFPGHAVPARGPAPPALSRRPKLHPALGTRGKLSWQTAIVALLSVHVCFLVVVAHRHTAEAYGMGLPGMAACACADCGVAGMGVRHLLRP